MQNAGMYAWDDLRCFLAVARAGSTLRAAQGLGVEQTTVARRIAGLERALEVRLFDRARSGYRLTQQGAALLPAAERVEAEAAALARAAGRLSRGLSGLLRVTAPEVVAQNFLTPMLGDFAEVYPDIRIQVAAGDRRLDLGAGEADIAVRAGPRPQDSGVVFRRLSGATWTVYCSRAYAARRGAPAAEHALKGHAVIAGEGEIAAIAGFDWLMRKAGAAEAAFYGNSLPMVVSGAKAGLGLAALPRIVGDREPDLVACFPAPVELDADIWLLVADAVKADPGARAFVDFLTARFAAQRGLWERR
jgi:DNA-binding transcriptional LysR family regulator